MVSWESNQLVKLSLRDFLTFSYNFHAYWIKDSIFQNPRKLVPSFWYHRSNFHRAWSMLAGWMWILQHGISEQFHEHSVCGMKMHIESCKLKYENFRGVNRGGIFWAEFCWQSFYPVLSPLVQSQRSSSHSGFTFGLTVPFANIGLRYSPAMICTQEKAKLCHVTGNDYYLCSLLASTGTCAALNNASKILPVFNRFYQITVLRKLS